MNTQLFNSDVTALYSELERIKFDAEDTEFTFVKRLTFENGWRIKYAERALVEYRRFLILVKLNDVCLSPSNAVDKVWHLHLIYSRSYWEDLCPKFLLKPLHHQPMDGAGKDKELFYTQYSRTLACYRETFGEAPPKDIWPNAIESASSAEHFNRGGLNEYTFKKRSYVGLSLVTAPILFLISKFFNDPFPAILWFSILSLIFLDAVFAIYAFRKRTRDEIGEPRCGGCG